ncbi:MAG: GGDEF domain-containing protein [Dehalococcoidaceae bacterium]|nr:GGDEF domain-containing protein [Dehalococcoidaceae bacterium]
MDQTSKTRQQLIHEVAELRLRLANLEKNETEYRATIESLRSQVVIDELTCLYNRRGLFELGEQYLKIARRLGKPVLLIFADFDNLKAVNDNFGHTIGDQVLAQTAKILKKAFRESDIISRISGDEFVILAGINQTRDIEIITSRLLHAIEKFNNAKRFPYVISLSLGTAVSEPGSTASIGELVKSADEAMYLGRKTRK